MGILHASLQSNYRGLKGARPEMINGSTYPLNDPPQYCALCHAPFIVENEYVKFWRGKDRRYYCFSEHADFGLEQMFAAAVEPVGRKVS